MKEYFCNIHKLKIVEYEPDEEHLFVDDNRREIAIFTDPHIGKYLKRYIIDGCDYHCPTIREIISNDNTSSGGS